MELFEQMSWRAFQVAYKPKIRVSVDWGGLEKHPPRVEMAFGPHHKLFFPWYEGASGRDAWRDGKMIPVPRGTEPALIRAPAARFRGRTVLLDGCHRVRAHCPRYLILDVLVLDSRNRRFLTEFV